MHNFAASLKDIRGVRIPAFPSKFIKSNRLQKLDTFFQEVSTHKSDKVKQALTDYLMASLAFAEAHEGTGIRPSEGSGADGDAVPAAEIVDSEGASGLCIAASSVMSKARTPETTDEPYSLAATAMMFKGGAKNDQAEEQTKNEGSESPKSSYDPMKHMYGTVEMSFEELKEIMQQSGVEAGSRSNGNVRSEENAPNALRMHKEDGEGEDDDDEVADDDNEAKQDAEHQAGEDISFRRSDCPTFDPGNENAISTEEEADEAEEAGEDVKYPTVQIALDPQQEGTGDQAQESVPRSTVRRAGEADQVESSVGSPPTELAMSRTALGTAAAGSKGRTSEPAAPPSDDHDHDHEQHVETKEATEDQRGAVEVESDAPTTPASKNSEKEQPKSSGKKSPRRTSLLFSRRGKKSPRGSEEASESVKDRPQKRSSFAKMAVEKINSAQYGKPLGRLPVGDNQLQEKLLPPPPPTRQEKKQAVGMEQQISAKAEVAVNSFIDMLKVAEELTKLAPDVGKNTERYEKAREKVTKLADPSKREALGALLILLFSKRQGSKSEEADTDVGAKNVIVLAGHLINAFCSMCSNPKTIDLACLLGEHLRVGLGVLSVLKLETAEIPTLQTFKKDSLSTLKLAQRNASRKLKSSKLPLNGLNFIIGCLQVAVEGLNADELKDAGKNAAKFVGSLVKSFAMMRMDESLFKSGKSFIFSGMDAKLQRKAARVSDQIFTDSALEHKAALAISTFDATVNSAKPSKALVAAEELNYAVLAKYVQGLVHSASALPCVDTVNSLPRWEIVCSTVDLLGNLLRREEIRKYPQLCQWLWDAHPIGNDNGSADGAVQSTEGNDSSFQGLSFFLTYGDESVQKQLGTQSMLVSQIVEWAKGLLIPDSFGSFNFKDKIEDLFALLSEALDDMIQRIKNGIVTMANHYVARVATAVKKGLHASAKAARFYLDRLVKLCEKTVKLLEPLIPVIEKASDVLMQLAGAKKFKINGVTMKEYLLDQQRKKIKKALDAATNIVKRTTITHLKPKLEPFLAKKGLEWPDVLPALEEVVSIADLKGAMEDMQGFLVRILKAVAIMALKPPLELCLAEEGLEWPDVLPVLKEMDSIDDLKRAMEDPKKLWTSVVTASGPAAKKLAEKRVAMAGGATSKQLTIKAKASKTASKEKDSKAVKPVSKDDGDQNAAGDVGLQVPEGARKKVLEMLKEGEDLESAMFDNAADMFSALPAVKKAQKEAKKVAHVMLTVGETLKQVRGHRVVSVYCVQVW
jgi:hypothetical protein